MTARTRIFAPVPRAAIAFRPEYLDFRRGLHIGNLEEDARLTRLLKRGLEALYGEEFITERWGRGVYWQWLGFLARANRAAKPQSSGYSFGCAKFFVTVNTGEKLLQCGLQVERASMRPARGEIGLAADWDWHRLLAGLGARGRLGAEVARLVREEGFQIRFGPWGDEVHLDADHWSGAAALKRRLAAMPTRPWVFFQLYFAMTEAEVRGSHGADLVEAMLAVFAELTFAMNGCAQTELTAP